MEGTPDPDRVKAYALSVWQHPAPAPAWPTTGWDPRERGASPRWATPGRARRWSRRCSRGSTGSSVAIGAARELVDDLPIELHVAGARAMPERGFDLVTFDALHDMAHPDRVAEVVRQTLREEDGVWLVKEVRSSGDFARGRRNPRPRHAVRPVGHDLPSERAVGRGGAVLGTLGLPPQAMEELGRETGFASVEQIDVREPANIYYVLRP